LLDEHDATGVGYPTVRDYVALRRTQIAARHAESTRHNSRFIARGGPADELRVLFYSPS
jgi:hypothetical protein